MFDLLQYRWEYTSNYDLFVGTVANYARVGKTERKKAPVYSALFKATISEAMDILE